MPDEVLTPDTDDEALNDSALEDDSAANDELDPAAVLAARFDQMEAKLEALSGLDVQGVRSALGRVSALQSSLDELSKRNPAAALDPRISANESVVTALAEALLNDPSISDATRMTLSGALRGVEQARTQRELDSREEALLEKVRAAAAPASASAVASDDDPWQRATATVKRRAAALSVDPATVPWGEIQARATDAEDAAALAIEWLVEHKPDAPVAAVAARRAAAGRGSPSREAAAGDIEQLRTRAMTESIPITDKASRERLAAELGVSL